MDTKESSLCLAFVGFSTLLSSKLDGQFTPILFYPLPLPSSLFYLPPLGPPLSPSFRRLCSRVRVSSRVSFIDCSYFVLHLTIWDKLVGVEYSATVVRVCRVCSHFLLVWLESSLPDKLLSSAPPSSFTIFLDMGSLLVDHCNTPK